MANALTKGTVMRRDALARVSQFFALTVLLLSCSGGGAEAASASPPAPAMTIRTITTDRAAYAPGAPVRVSIEIAAAAGNRIGAGAVTLQARHLEVTLPAVVRADFAARAGSTATVELLWQPPADDFKGYAIEAVLADGAGKVLDRRSSAVDVSSSWTRFPRYGYLTDYSATQDPQGVMRQLNAWHLNALQFYDWQWKHHWPVKGSSTNPDASWAELSTRTVYKSVLQNLISQAHQRGMVAMQYNLIYGAFADFATDGVDPRWGLFDAPGGVQWKLDMPAGWTTPALYSFNPANSGWQKFILDREMEVFQAFAFDGWHSDTVGETGPKYDADGAPVDIKATFKPFLTAAKQRLGSKYLVMNAVSAKGHLEVNTSPVDVIYMEIWPWDGFPDYKSLKDVVDQARAESGGKSLVVPAYMNYDYAKTKSDAAPGLFNEPGVLLTEATVVAAGGSRLELGEGSQMLCSDYFPNRSLVMSDSLKAKMQQYYDFLVAYENLLRDGQENTPNVIETPGVPNSSTGARNTVWTFAKQDARYEIVHLINLLGTAHVSWRDSDATQQAPTAVENLGVKYYYSGAAGKVYVTSPDVDAGRPRELAAHRGSDTGGKYVRFTLPRLAYWSVVFLPKAAE